MEIDLVCHEEMEKIVAKVNTPQIQEEVEDELIDRLQEIRQSLEHLNQGMLVLENNPLDSAALDQVVSAAYTLTRISEKGELNRVTQILQRIEGVLNAVEQGNITIEKEVLDWLFQGLGFIDLLLNAIESGEADDLDGDEFCDTLDQATPLIGGLKKDAEEEAIEAQLKKIEAKDLMPRRIAAVELAGEETRSTPSVTGQTTSKEPYALESTNYLLFSLQGLRYALEALAVREILWLPELTLIAETPDYIVGVFNLRGNIVPVMDLNLRLGRMPQRYRQTDSVIILEQEEFLLGIIANEVHDVRHISMENIKAAPSYGREGGIRSRFVASVAKIDEDLVMVLNHKTLIQSTESVEELVAGEAEDRIEQPYTSAVEHSYFYPEATLEEKSIFHERAQALRQSAEDQDLTGQIPIAVVGLIGEYFGVDLDVVLEFSEIHDATPVPCCPEHIIGDINLRGDILTVVDVRGVLKIPLAGSHSKGPVIVVQVDELLVGVLVDKVFDVIYLRPADITPVPLAVRSMSEEYIKGTYPYGEKMLSVLDLPKILRNGGLIVDDEV